MDEAWMAKTIAEAREKENIRRARVREHFARWLSPGEELDLQPGGPEWDRWVTFGAAALTLGPFVVISNRRIMWLFDEDSGPVSFLWSQCQKVVARRPWLSRSDLWTLIVQTSDGRKSRILCASGLARGVAEAFRTRYQDAAVTPSGAPSPPARLTGRAAAQHVPETRSDPAQPFGSMSAEVRAALIANRATMAGRLERFGAEPGLDVLAETAPETVTALGMRFCTMVLPPGAVAPDAAAYFLHAFRLGYECGASALERSAVSVATSASNVSEADLGEHVSNYACGIHGGALLDQLGLLPPAQRAAQKYREMEQPEWFVAVPQDQTRYVISIALGLIASAAAWDLGLLEVAGAPSNPPPTAAGRRTLEEAAPELYAALGPQLSAIVPDFLRTVHDPLGLVMLPPLAAALVPPVDPSGLLPQEVCTRGFTGGYYACRRVLGSNQHPDIGMDPTDVADWVKALDLAGSADASPPRGLRDWASKDYPVEEAWAPVLLGIAVAVGEAVLMGVSPPASADHVDPLAALVDGPLVVPPQVAAISHLMGCDDVQQRLFREAGVDVCWPDVDMQAESLGINLDEFERQRVRTAESRAERAEEGAHALETVHELLTSLSEAGLAGREIEGHQLHVNLDTTQLVVSVAAPSFRLGEWMLPVTARCVIPGHYNDDMGRLMQAFQPLASLCSWHWDARSASSVAATRWFIPVEYDLDDIRFLRDALGMLALEAVERARALTPGRVAPSSPVAGWLEELRKRIEHGRDGAIGLDDLTQAAVAKLAQRGWSAQPGPHDGWYEVRDPDAPLVVTLVAVAPHPNYGAGVTLLSALAEHPNTPEELIEFVLHPDVPVAAFGSFTAGARAPSEVAFGAFLPAGLADPDRVRRLVIEATALAAWVAANPT